ncbi:MULTISPECIES: hypothetical protein [unclassified Variovorax]|uniref:hypothetical protein n=1 Tax=unclassified Variovorax TaxID=663243 RepID=UPI00022A685A|nr:MULTISPECIES: hypothetical protein [unclassified Variovorax]AEO20118.1 hypothetical protein VASRS_43 [Variovorax sp. SRS16]KWT98210.1 hypothetical protein APY03_0881 [Variovorax sp. WDL1]PNG50295.1 hypothetical protein CHC06_05918 [Variovorax sp. B2]PNG51168.1 hypothetical protein CHC07_05824 [Variovorax sp. B4]VTU42690.1 hypothetical protein SRS16P1_00333 [Variovorax sp. SRS16]
MTPQQIVGLAARLFAIWLAISAFQAFAIAQALKASNNPDAVWVPYLVAGLYVGAGALLWLFPMSVAHRLVPKTRFEDKLQLPSQQALVVACVVLGLLVIAIKALPAVLKYLSLCAIVIANGQPITTMDPWMHIDGMIGFGELAVGIFLATKAHAVAARLIPSAAV